MCPENGRFVDNGRAASFDGLAGLWLLKYPSIFQSLETVNESTHRICPRFD